MLRPPLPPCPHAADDVDLRNGTGGGYANMGACRGDTLMAVTYDSAPTVYTPPFVASSDCTGYYTLDPL